MTTPRTPLVFLAAASVALSAVRPQAAERRADTPFGADVRVLVDLGEGARPLRSSVRIALDPDHLLWLEATRDGCDPDAGDDAEELAAAEPFFRALSEAAPTRVARWRGERVLDFGPVPSGGLWALRSESVYDFVSPPHVEVEATDEEGTTATFEVTVVRGGALAGRVVDGDGAPAAGVRVVAHGTVPDGLLDLGDAFSPGNVRTDVTGPDGRYFLRGLGPRDAVRVALRREGAERFAWLDLPVAVHRWKVSDAPDLVAR